MFATLASGYPRPTVSGDTSSDDVIRAVVGELEEAGLGMLSDGAARRDDPLGGIATRLQGFEMGDPVPYLETGRTYRRPRAIHEPRWDGAIYVREWQVAAQATELPVKQAMVGPYTLGRLVDPGPLTRDRLTMALADALAHELRALLAAGCPVIQIDEDAAILIGESKAEQQLFRAAHRRLTSTVRGAHLSLAVTGGSIARIPPKVFFDAPYRSYLVDLVTAPDNWELLVEAPGDRGIIAGVANARTDAADDPEFLAWAALYAAAIRQRGPDRVGLAPSGSLAGRTRDVAWNKLELLVGITADMHARVAATPELLDPEHLSLVGLAAGYFGPAAHGEMAEAKRRLAGEDHAEMT